MLECELCQRRVPRLTPVDVNRTGVRMDVCDECRDSVGTSQLGPTYTNDGSQFAEYEDPLFMESPEDL